MAFANLQLAEQLGQVPHFAGIPAGDLRAIVEAGHVRHISAGQSLFLQGAPCAGLFVLLHGEVQVRVVGPQGHEHTLATFEPVRMFNEVAVLDGGANVGSALATQDSVVWHIAHSSFGDVLERYPSLGVGLARVLAARNRILVERHADVAFRSVLARTARTVLDLSQNGQVPIDRRQHDNTDLAARVASVPEAVSRCLKTLQVQGLITCTRARLSVLDAAGLDDLAQAGRTTWRVAA